MLNLHIPETRVSRGVFICIGREAGKPWSHFGFALIISEGQWVQHLFTACIRRYDSGKRFVHVRGVRAL